MPNHHQPPSEWQYLFSILIPPYSIIAGIVAMSRSMVGPGLALWATGFLGAFVFWPTAIMVLAYSQT